MGIINIKGRLHDKRILAVLSHSQYMPTEAKLSGLAAKYESDNAVSAFAWEDDNHIYGVILLKRLAGNEVEIVSIATDPAVRNQKIASRLISHAIRALNCAIINAETDDDAVGFYRKYGFQIKSLGEKYPGIIRYFCTLNVH